MVATAVTLNDLEGHSALADVFKCIVSNIRAAFYTISTDSVLAWFLCISRASCSMDGGRKTRKARFNERIINVKNVFVHLWLWCYTTVPDISVSSSIEVASPRLSDNVTRKSVLDDTSVVVGVIKPWSIVIHIHHNRWYRRRASQRRETCTWNNSCIQDTANISGDDDRNNTNHSNNTSPSC